MNQNQNAPQALNDRLADLLKLAEKVALTPEVEQFVREHLEAAQEKLAKGKRLNPKDLRFIEEATQWIEAPQPLREQYPSIDSFLRSDEVLFAKKHLLDLQRGYLLLKMISTLNHDPEDIGKLFRFEGNPNELGNKDIVSLSNLDFCLTDIEELPDYLVVNGNLDLRGCSRLRGLPRHLHVIDDLHLSDCVLLESLPDDLIVGEHLTLNRCERLKSIPKGLLVRGNLQAEDCVGLTSLPPNFTVESSLLLKGCKNLESLPEGLNVGYDLNLEGCTRLRSFPNQMNVEGNVIVQKGLDPSFYERLKKLKSKGMIRGKIIQKFKGLAELLKEQN